MPYFTVT